MSSPSPVPTDSSDPDAGGELLPAIARAAILEALSGKPPKGKLPEVAGYLAQSRAVFVTLRDKKGELRGCIGSVEPKASDLIAETRESAKLAALGDPLCEPVKDSRELKKLSIEVSVLGPLERVESIIELDPEIYGVVLTATKTGNRGVMLPNEPGLNTVDKQLAAIRRKAGLRPDERLRIERFRVETFTEAE
ncbi:MAG: AmmeMemoRadiSam system protein A [Verrucomicrobiae bacterium]|nr:AmmeMemoRadiSam system protein A [Verrucomicrobiae bacterium]